MPKYYYYWFNRIHLSNTRGIYLDIRIKNYVHIYLHCSFMSFKILYILTYEMKIDTFLISFSCHFFLISYVIDKLKMSDIILLNRNLKCSFAYTYEFVSWSVWWPWRAYEADRETCSLGQHCKVSSAPQVFVLYLTMCLQSLSVSQVKFEQRHCFYV